jgi:hypothetical protein
MSKWILFLFFCGLSSELTPVQESKKKYSFAQFTADFEKFYVDPGWIVSAFVSLPLDEFDKAWELFITTLRVSPKKFFTNGAEVYSEKKYRETFLAHCYQYDLFLKNLLVDIQNKRLVLVTGSERTQYLKQPGVVTVGQYWQAKNNTVYQHFYAFYFDTLVLQLYETITIAYREHDTSDYPVLYKKAKQYAMLITKIFKQLRGGEYDGRYAYHLKRYKEVLDILQKERRLQEGGSDAVA